MARVHTAACQVAVTAVLVMSCAFPVFAQSTEQRAVQQKVEEFLLHLGDHQLDAVAGDLTSKGLVIVTRQRDGTWTNTYQTTEEWLDALKRNQNPIRFREPITNVTVTIDSNQLAYLRADFQVVRDGRPVSKGVDQFTLVRESAGWKIAVIAYTSVAAGEGR
jgi:Tfp pilus assembly protein FimT